MIYKLRYTKQRYRFNIVKLIFFSALFFSMVSCDSNHGDYELQEMIYEVFPEYREIDIVCYAVTEYDCSLCLESIKAWEKDIRTSSEISQVGIIYMDEVNVTLTQAIQRFKLPETINWRISSEVDWFEYLAEKYSSVKPPRIIGISQNEIDFVSSINLDTFHIDAK